MYVRLDLPWDLGDDHRGHMLHPKGSDFPKKPHVSFLPPKNVVKSWNVSEIEMGQRE